MSDPNPTPSGTAPATPDAAVRYRTMKTDCPACVERGNDPPGVLALEWHDYGRDPDMSRDCPPVRCPTCMTWWEARYRPSDADDWWHRFKLEETDPPDGWDDEPDPDELAAAVDPTPPVALLTERPPTHADMKLVAGLMAGYGPPVTVEHADGTYTTTWEPRYVQRDPADDVAYAASPAFVRGPETLPPPDVGLVDAVARLRDAMERRILRSLNAMPFLRGPDGDR